MQEGILERCKSGLGLPINRFDFDLILMKTCKRQRIELYEYISVTFMRVSNTTDGQPMMCVYNKIRDSARQPSE